MLKDSNIIRIHSVVSFSIIDDSRTAFDLSCIRLHHGSTPIQYTSIFMSVIWIKM